MSRHDHFPRHDPARCEAAREATDALAEDWRAEDTCPGGLIAAMDALADAPPAAAIDALLPWLADIGWLRARLAAALTLIAADPFARPPLRLVGGGDGPCGLVLAERGAIRLSLLLQPFTAGAAAIRILAGGGARLRRHRIVGAAAQPTFTAAGAGCCESDPPQPLSKDMILRLDTAREAMTLVGASGDLLLLDLAVHPPSSLPVQTYDIASGRLVHVASARRDASFRQMALALLGAFGSRDAAPLFVEATRDDDFAARWSAMRQLVALDPAAARAPLAAMAAADPHPEVRAAAGATLALYPSFCAAKDAHAPDDRSPADARI
ncbi:HEAT repeat domain-containing protein [Sphingopyxis terrae]|uniref:HEAT repeat-containing protein n=1 Tax=Sphingopyxis terrae subsp. ummariensis TaxID=429001 RepID=A0A1Y6EQC3_9SPHN|nr:HEAT repeat domain-containing protein [Sphingopyxis terrae]PCF92493.1 HEAT repeat domain-containing protein [Sphingopyxis terrae subsp. ummariensis]SMQ64479.1 HEAT repeat-containing protein [Sphingopyxis terrae subsp. ummariensis]